MLSRVLICVLGAATVVGVPGVAAADPPPVPAPQPPPLPNVNALAPVKPSEYAVMDGAWYAFSTGGLTCVLQRSGTATAAAVRFPVHRKVRILSAARWAAYRVSPTAGSVFAAASAAKPLPAGSRISYQSVSCGNDGATTTCVDSRSQSGFVISPAGSFILNEAPPLLYRPEGTSPFVN